MARTVLHGTLPEWITMSECPPDKPWRTGNRCRMFRRHQLVSMAILIQVTPGTGGEIRCNGAVALVMNGYDFTANGGIGTIYSPVGGCTSVTIKNSKFGCSSNGTSPASTMLIQIQFNDQCYFRKQHCGLYRLHRLQQRRNNWCGRRLGCLFAGHFRKFSF